MTGGDTAPGYRDFWMPPSKSFAKAAFIRIAGIKRYPVGELAWKNRTEF